VIAAANGVRPHIDLNEVLGDRARERDVTMGERTWVFRPINLASARLLDEGKTEEAFAALVVGGPDEAEAFLEAAPAAHLDEIVRTIYGLDALGKPVAPSPGSPPKKDASTRSKRTSTRKATP